MLSARSCCTNVETNETILRPITDSVSEAEGWPKFYQKWFYVISASLFVFFCTKINSRLHDHFPNSEFRFLHPPCYLSLQTFDQNQMALIFRLETNTRSTRAISEGDGATSGVPSTTTPIAGLAQLCDRRINPEDLPRASCSSSSPADLTTSTPYIILLPTLLRGALCRGQKRCLQTSGALKHQVRDGKLCCVSRRSTRG